MAELFPGERRRARRRWCSGTCSSGDPGGAEAVLRAAAARAPTTREPALTVVQFLLELRGPDAARAELDRLAVAAAADPRPFQRARAGLDFAAGRPRRGHRRAARAGRRRRAFRRHPRAPGHAWPRCSPTTGAGRARARRSSPPCSRPTRRMWRR